MARACLALASIELASCGGAGEAEVRARGTLEVVIDAAEPSSPISPYVYGLNGLDHIDGMDGVVTLVRLGGTRCSTYNWENNASNAGHDPPQNQNDGFMSESSEPGAAVTRVLDHARALGAAALVTVPMVGYVAADRSAGGDVGRSPDYLRTRFRRSLARGATGDAPLLDDDVVHQDAFVRFVRREAEERRVPIFFALDNEPGGWPVTLPRLREGRPITYRELVDRSIEHATMIHDEAPDAGVFGPVSFGYPDMRDLAGAPDADGRDLLEHYLGRMRAEEQRSGRRVLDVLDVHWYPDVRVGGRPVAGGSDEAALARERMQLPRSLYDPSYRERSWIARDALREPVRLLPRLRSLIARAYPRTRIAITEYSYGGGAHVSGAVAQADALGALGRYGTFAAAYWPLTDQSHDYALAAFRMFRRVDGEVSFGDRSIPATSSDLSRLSAWASLDSQRADRVVVVLVGRADRSANARMSLRGRAAFPARRFVLDASGPRPRRAGTIRPSARGEYVVPIPARSVTTLIIDGEAEPAPHGR